MVKGYIYCFSNKSLNINNDYLLKIGISTKEPIELLKEINKFNEWGPPTKYHCEYAKKVNNASQKINTLYKIINKYRVNSQLDFFLIKKHEVKEYFDLMDGKLINITDKDIDEDYGLNPSFHNPDRDSKVIIDKKNKQNEDEDEEEEVVDDEEVEDDEEEVEEEEDDEEEEEEEEEDEEESN